MCRASYATSDLLPNRLGSDGLHPIGKRSFDKVVRRGAAKVFAPGRQGWDNRCCAAAAKQLLLAKICRLCCVESLLLQWHQNAVSRALPNQMESSD